MATSPHEIYQREAERLRAMADSFQYYDVREEFLKMADVYDSLARQHQGLHSVGQED